MSKLFKILILVIVLALIIFGGGMFYLTRGLDKISDIKVSGLNINDIKDGIYNGKFISGRWSNMLSVTIKDKKITNIEIIDDVTFSNPSVRDELFAKVIEAQNTTVDVISQATVTSKAYLKSIEDAINNK